MDLCGYNIAGIQHVLKPYNQLNQFLRLILLQNLSMASAASGVWGSGNSNAMSWANEAPSTWGNPQTTKAPMGFWDECARENTNPVLKTK